MAAVGFYTVIIAIAIFLLIGEQFGLWDARQVIQDTSSTIERIADPTGR